MSDPGTYMDDLLVWLEELDTVAEGVSDVASVKAWKRFVFDNCYPGALQPTPKGIEILDVEGDVGLRRRDEVGVHAEMKLQVPSLEPDAAPLRQVLRLRSLGQA